MQIRVIECGGFIAATQAMRLPMKSGDKSDSGWDLDTPGKAIPWSGPYAGLNGYITGGCAYRIGSKDNRLSENLVRSGDDEGKHIRHMSVSFEIKAPLYWWNEFDTYRFGVSKNSDSTMHTLLKSEITAEDFCFDEWRDEETGDLPAPLERFIDWLESWRKVKDIQAMKEVLPSGYYQTRIVTCSYQALRHMYQARKNHRLKEWRQFCEFLHHLPYWQYIVKPYLALGEGPLTEREIVNFETRARATCTEHEGICDECPLNHSEHCCEIER